MNNKDLKNKKTNRSIIPNGMKKTGNLKSIFSDNTKIFIKKDNNLILVTEKKCPNLFWFLFNNWEKNFMEAYIEVNKGFKKFEKTLNIYIPNEKFNYLKKGIPNIKNTIFLQFPANQDFMQIMNEFKLNIDKSKEKMI